MAVKLRNFHSAVWYFPQCFCYSVDAIMFRTTQILREINFQVLEYIQNSSEFHESLYTEYGIQPKRISKIFCLTKKYPLHLRNTVWKKHEILSH